MLLGILIGAHAFYLAPSLHAEEQKKKNGDEKAWYATPDLDTRDISLQKEEEEILARMSMKPEVAKAASRSEKVNTTKAAEEIARSTVQVKEPIRDKSEKTTKTLEGLKKPYPSAKIAHSEPEVERKIQPEAAIPLKQETSLSQADIQKLVHAEEEKLRGDLNELRGEVSSWREEMLSSQRELLDETKKMNIRLELLEIEDKKPQEEDQEISKKFESINKEYAGLKQKIESQASILDSLKIADGQLRARAGESEKVIETISSDVKSIKDQLGNFDKVLQQLNQKLTDVMKRQDPVVYSGEERWSDWDNTYSSLSPWMGARAHNSVTENMPLVTIRVDQTKLWSGPTEKDAVLDVSPRGSRLAVEYRQDDWYRVIAPDGGRAWIPARDVVFNRLSDTSYLQVSGVTEQG